MILIHFFHYFYVPTSGPWYAGNVWGNVFVIPVAAVLGYAWAKTKFWPLLPLKHVAKRVEGLHDKHDRLIERVEALHDKHDALHSALEDKDLV